MARSKFIGLAAVALLSSFAISSPAMASPQNLTVSEYEQPYTPPSVAYEIIDQVVFKSTPVSHGKPSYDWMENRVRFFEEANQIVTRFGVVSYVRRSPNVKGAPVVI